MEVPTVGTNSTGTVRVHFVGMKDEFRQSNPQHTRLVQTALGMEPLTNARHLLQPVPLPPFRPPLLPGPRTQTNFVIDLEGPFPVAAEVVHALLDSLRGGDTGWFRVWAKFAERSSKSSGVWHTGDAIPNTGPLLAVALSWELTGLLFEGIEAARELGGYAASVQGRFAPLGVIIVPRETPATAAERATRLLAIKERFARSVEMRLLTSGRAFPARSVWRAAYALGLTWGDMDLFHWHEPSAGLRLFTLSSLGQPGYFLPERAAEGEGVPGLLLSFELPLCPAPLPTYDRMAIALSFLSENLGGRPASADGREFDADALYDQRDALEEADRLLRAAGLPPGSPEAQAFF